MLLPVPALQGVEDAKGNPGLAGTLCMTNLRLTWASHRDPCINLSIGHGCIADLSVRDSSSRIRGGWGALLRAVLGPCLLRGSSLDRAHTGAPCRAGACSARIWGCMVDPPGPQRASGAPALACACTTGNTAALRLLARFNNQRFEFIFSSPSASTAALHAWVQAAWKAYEASRLYREIKLRGKRP
jgi:hypothetical protein